jgi:carbamoyl-phosphate synthase large subunit
MAGQKLADQAGLGGQAPHEVVPPYFSIKEAVFPFNKFPGVDPILGPEMRSTGEVMGLDRDFAAAYLKSQLAAGAKLPLAGTAFISVKESDKAAIVEPARQLVAMGFAIVATRGTAAHLQAAGVACTPINKKLEGRPHIVDAIL